MVDSIKKVSGVNGSTGGGSVTPGADEKKINSVFNPNIDTKKYWGKENTGEEVKIPYRRKEEMEPTLEKPPVENPPVKSETPQKTTKYVVQLGESIEGLVKKSLLAQGIENPDEKQLADATAKFKEANKEIWRTNNKKGVDYLIAGKEAVLDGEVDTTGNKKAKEVDDAWAAKHRKQPKAATPPAKATTPPAKATTPPAKATTPPAGGTTPPAGGTTPPAGPPPMIKRPDPTKLPEEFDMTKWGNKKKDGLKLPTDKILEDIKNGKATTPAAPAAKAPVKKQEPKTELPDEFKLYKKDDKAKNGFRLRTDEILEDIKNGKATTPAAPAAKAPVKKQEPKTELPDEFKLYKKDDKAKNEFRLRTDKILEDIKNGKATTPAAPAAKAPVKKQEPKTQLPDEFNLYKKEIMPKNGFTLRTDKIMEDIKKVKANTPAPAPAPPKAPTISPDERVKNIINATDGLGTDEDSFFKNIMKDIKYDEKTGYEAVPLSAKEYKAIDQQLIAKTQKGVMDILKSEFSFHPESNSYESEFTDKGTYQNWLAAMLYDRLKGFGLKEYKK